MFFFCCLFLWIHRIHPGQTIFVCMLELLCANTQQQKQNLFHIIWKDSYKFIPHFPFGFLFFFLSFRSEFNSFDSVSVVGQSFRKYFFFPRLVWFVFSWLSFGLHNISHFWLLFIYLQFYCLSFMRLLWLRTRKTLTLTLIYTFALNVVQNFIWTWHSQCLCRFPHKSRFYFCSTDI